MNNIKWNNDFIFYRSTSASSNSTTVSNGSTSTSETLHIKSQRDSNRRLEMTEVQFSSELFMAPEMMYCSLELPSMVEECTKELPDHILKECFSNILITGMYADIISLKSFLQVFWQCYQTKMDNLFEKKLKYVEYHK